MAQIPVSCSVLPSAPVGPRQQCLAFALMTVYIWVLPVGHTIALRHSAFFLWTLFTIWLGLRGTLRLRVPMLGPWSIYAGVALLSLTYAFDPLYTLSEIKSDIGYGVLALWLAATWVRDFAALSNVVAVVIVGASVMIFAALANGFILSPFWQQENVAVTSLYSGVGVFSTYLIAVLPFMIAYRLLLPPEAALRRKLLLVLVCGAVVALYLTGNRAGLPVLALEGLIVVAFGVVSPKFRLPRKAIAAIVACTLIVGAGAISLFNQRPVGVDPRGEIWRVALQDIKARPMTGGGFGMAAFKSLNPEYVQTHPVHGHAHNMVLNKGVQMGVPGMLAFLMLWLAVVYRLWPGRCQSVKHEERVYAVAALAMVAGMFLKNMTDDFFTNDTALLFWVLCGAVMGARMEPRQ